MNEFIDELNRQYSYERLDNGIIIHTSIMYDAADHTFSFCIKKSENGSFVITDRGQTLDYLRENVDPAKYSEKIDRVCEFFEIELINGEFVGQLASLESNQTMRNFNNFISAMSMIAYVNVL